uniref:Uncharacterized protein n=1 Tax=Trichinella nativa TaxID=6335 RepID=A0A0V1KI81_9BILA
MKAIFCFCPACTSPWTFYWLLCLYTLHPVFWRGVSILHQSPC